MHPIRRNRTSCRCHPNGRASSPKFSRVFGCHHIHSKNLEYGRYSPLPLLSALSALSVHRLDIHLSFLVSIPRPNPIIPCSEWGFLYLALRPRCHFPLYLSSTQTEVNEQFHETVKPAAGDTGELRFGRQWSSAQILQGPQYIILSLSQIAFHYSSKSQRIRLPSQ